MKTLMNIRNTIGITLCAVAFTACEKEDLPEFGLQAEMNLAYEDIEFTVPASEITGSIAMELDFDPEELEDMLVSNGYTMDDLKEIRLTSASIHLVDDNGSFDPIGFVQLRMLGGGYMDQLVAEIQDVQDGATSISLNTGGENLMDLFQFSDIQLAVVGQVTEALEQDLPLRAAITFKVVVETGA